MYKMEAFDNEMLIRNIMYYFFALVDTGNQKVVEVGANYVEGCNSFDTEPFSLK